MKQWWLAVIFGYQPQESRNIKPYKTLNQQRLDMIGSESLNHRAQEFETGELFFLHIFAIDTQAGVSECGFML